MIVIEIIEYNTFTIGVFIAMTFGLTTVEEKNSNNKQSCKSQSGMLTLVQPYPKPRYSRQSQRIDFPVPYR